MTLSDEELERYQRQILLKEVGGAGQQRLRQAKVLVIGAGGLGSPVLLYLAAAGVGTIGVIDDDTVSVDNLQRQIAHSTDRVGLPKTESARAQIAALNPHVSVIEHRERLDADNALDIIGAYDVVADGTDNFAARYLAADACHLARRPLVSAAMGQFEGQIAVFRSFEPGPDGNPGATYRCLYPEPPPAGAIPTCEEAGILGPLPGIIGSIQAIEVLKQILGIGEPLTARLLLYDALFARFQTFRIPWDPDNPLNGRRPVIVDLSHHRDGGSRRQAASAS